MEAGMPRRVWFDKHEALEVLMEKRIQIDMIKFQTAGFSPLQWAKATLSILSIGFHFSIR